jgi:actin-related protein
MTQASARRYPTDPDPSQVERSNWAEMCREQFDLPPTYLAMLVMIAAYEDATGQPMPVAEMRRVAPGLTGIYRIDYCDGPSALFRLGLANRVGRQIERAYSMTAKGRRRLVR